MALGVDRAAVVIGGGITGLVCTWRLRRVGVEALCLESSNRPGGALSSRRIDGFVLEAGAHTVQENPSLGDLIREVGLGGEMLRAPRNLRRFVYRFGSLHPLPTGVLSGLGSRLISTRAKGRLLGELAVKRRVSTGRGRLARSESLELQLVDALVAPFVSGTFAGDPAALSARALLPSLVAMEERYGSALRGMLARAIATRRRREHGERALISFRDGLETLPVRLAARLGEAVQVDTEVLSITHDASADDSVEIEIGQAAKFDEPRGDAACSADAVTARRACAGVPRAVGDPGRRWRPSASWPRERSHPQTESAVAAGEALHRLLMEPSIFPGSSATERRSRIWAAW
jgi:protoporphyrinogen oxidase